MQQTENIASSLSASGLSLHNAQQLFEALDAHAIVSIADASGTILEVNNRSCAVSSYAREELVGQNHRVLKSGMHGEDFYTDMWVTIAMGKTWSGEVCNRAKDGSLYWVRSTIVPFLDENGLPFRYVSLRTEITELKRVQIALKISEERLRRSQAYANIGTWDWNIQTGDLYWSERIGPLFGYDDMVETTYENFLKAVHPDDREAVVNAVNACVERDVPYDIEHRCVWPDGSIHWMLERGAITRSADGAPQHMLGVVQDITERKLAQIEQVRVADRNRALMESAHDAILIASKRGILIDANRRAEELTGRSRAELIGLPVTELHPPQDLEKIRASFGEIMVTGQQLIEQTLCRPDGFTIPVEISATLFRRDEGDYILGVFRDMTDHKITELTIRNLAQRFRDLVETSADWVWEVDTLGRYTYSSPRVQNLLGYRAEEILGKTVFDFMPAEEAERVKADFLRLVAARQPIENLINRNLHKDGHLVILETSGAPIIDDEGILLGYRGIDRNVTERFERLNALIAAKEEAERANSAKSEFLPRMSHELRTPLNAILGFAQLLDIGMGLTPSQHENARFIMRAGRHLLDMINEILDLARIESGQVQLAIEPVALGQVVADSLALLGPLAQKQDIAVHAEAMPAAVLVAADRLRLKQVLVNLVANAIKYNRPQGKVSVSHELRGDRLRVSVRDTGFGIPPERTGELFQPFFRLVDPASEIEGSGIGLVISRRLIESMHGVLNFTSRVGEGSEFWFELPLASAETKVGAGGTAQTLPLLAAHDASDAAELAKVLYIEDDPANVKLMYGIFGLRPQWRLITAHTPVLGIKLAQLEQPDLILLDIGLPDMDGYAVLAALRADPLTADIPAVAVTANVLAERTDTQGPGGFRCYMTKPLDVSALLSLIETILEEEAAP